MQRCCSVFTVLSVVGIAAVAGSIAVAQPSHDNKKAPSHAPAAAAPAGQPELPKGWTEADMAACMEAGMTGEMHEFLAKQTGVWQGKNKMWMGPDSEPMLSECTSTVTTMMDGRFMKCEIAGDMPGMGPFNGFGIYGFDNVSKKFQCTWVDNCGTGMMIGTGELSSDKNTLTWSFTYNCPIAKKAVTMREVETFKGPNSKTLEMFMNDPKTGKEYKMMEIAFTRKSDAVTATPAASN